MQCCKWKLKPVAALVMSVLANGAFAQDEGVVQTENVSVFGNGQARQVQNINSEDMKKAAAGTSALKVLEKLPGVHFTSSDPWGNYEWSTRFNVRGFAQQQMGFTLDGVPLGDMSYGNNNGLHISRAISSENIRKATISHGAGALGTASTSNLGGTVEFFSTDPGDKGEIQLQQTVGSNSTSRTFVRLDTGRTQAGGTKAYFSFTNMKSKKWKGWGPQDSQQINSKFVHLWGENRLSAFLNASDRSEADYADLSLQSQQVLGWGWDNYAPDWQTAVNAANGIFTPRVLRVVNGPYAGQIDAAYYLGRGLRKDFLGGVSGDFKLTDAARLAATVYHHNNKGQGHWYTPYTPTGPGNPISLRTTEYTINRTGLTATLDYVMDNHDVKAGLWYESSDHNLARRFYAVTGPFDTNTFLSGPMSTGFEQKFVTRTTVFHVQDTMSLMDDRMKLAFGFKSPDVTITATNIVGTRGAGQITARKSFLPQAGVNYKLNESDEVFANAAQNMRAYQPGVTGPFSASLAAFNASLATLKPEESINLDVGVRMKRDVFQTSLTGYLVDFKNRQLNISTCPGIAGCPSAFANVGKVQTKGVEAAASWNFAPRFSWFNSLTINDSKYKNNYLNGAALVLTSGKTVVDAPKVLFNTELTYESNGYFAKIGAKYTDKRYISYLNDSQVPAYTVVDAGAGYKQKKLAGIEDFTVQLNITNLLDKKYFGTVGSNGFVETDPAGNNMTLQEGAPRQAFLLLSGKF